MRLLKKSTFNRFITFFVSVGVGSLSGSAVFHLLPQAFGLVNEFDPNANHAYLYKAFAAVVGIYLFFFADKAIKMILEIRKVSFECRAINYLLIFSAGAPKLKCIR
jgi:zinc transporter 14